MSVFGIEGVQMKIVSAALCHPIIGVFDLHLKRIVSQIAHIRQLVRKLYIRILEAIWIWKPETLVFVIVCLMVVLAMQFVTRVAGRYQIVIAQRHIRVLAFGKEVVYVWLHAIVVHIYAIDERSTAIRADSQPFLLYEILLVICEMRRFNFDYS